MTTETTDKQREIITINCGGAGCNIGQNLLEQFATEHGISSSGYKECKTPYDYTTSILFDETSKGNYVSRSLFTDLEPYSIHNIRSRYPYNSLLHSEYLINGKSSACLNFAMGHYTKGKELMVSIENALRTLVEATDNLQGFLFNHSLSGGTGGGLGTLILERLAVNYRKKTKFAMTVFFDNEKSASSMEIYNSILCQHHLLDNSDIDIVFDNKSCNNICKNILKTETQSYKQYNNIISKFIGDITANSRFGINEIFSSIHMDMVPYPRLHFLIPSMWPLIPRMKRNLLYPDDIQTLMNQCLHHKHHMVDTPDFDVEEDKHMALSFCCRGNDINNSMSQCNATLQFMRTNKKVTFTEWTSSKPMVKYVNAKAAQLPSDNMLVTDKQISMVMNNPCISRLYSYRISRPYDILYGNRCYVHNYVSQGMEEGEFREAREDLGFLEKDYLDVLSDQVTDDYDDDDDY